MMRVFVYEHLSGAGSAIAGAELLGAGLAMRDAVVHDLLRAGDLRVSVAADHAGACGARCGVAGAGAAGNIRRRLRRATRPACTIACGSSHPRPMACSGNCNGPSGAGRWLGCAAEAIALASSKRATLARAAAHRVLTPLAFATSRASSRWVVKPDDGAGAVATRVHDTLAAARGDAEARLQRGESATLEAWVAGEPLSLSLLCRAGRTELLSVNRQQLVVDAAGKLSFTGVQIAALPLDDARAAALDVWAQTLVGAITGLMRLRGCRSGVARTARAGADRDQSPRDDGLCRPLGRSRTQPGRGRPGGAR
jgi:predicted ATP-grasp superfamily ATP-dependent carboligase